MSSREASASSVTRRLRQRLRNRVTKVSQARLARPRHSSHGHGKHDCDKIMKRFKTSLLQRKKLRPTKSAFSIRWHCQGRNNLKVALRLIYRARSPRLAVDAALTMPITKAWIILMASLIYFWRPQSLILDAKGQICSNSGRESATVPCVFFVGCQINQGRQLVAIPDAVNCYPEIRADRLLSQPPLVHGMMTSAAFLDILLKLTENQTKPRLGMFEDHLASGNSFSTATFTASGATNGRHPLLPLLSMTRLVTSYDPKLQLSHDSGCIH